MDRTEIDRRHRQDYLRTRSGRHPGDADIEPIWANEAAADPIAQVIDPDPAGKSGRTARIIGYSPSADMVLTIIVLEEGGVTYGVNAWRSNTRDEHEYWEME